MPFEFCRRYKAVIPRHTNLSFSRMISPSSHSTPLISGSLNSSRRKASWSLLLPVNLRLTRMALSNFWKLRQALRKGIEEHSTCLVMVTSVISALKLISPDAMYFANRLLLPVAFRAAFGCHRGASLAAPGM
jgi:hypothetical protein